LLKGIPVKLNTDFFDRKDYWLSRCKKLIYTGPIDRYFNDQFGHLKWRSVRFESEKLKMDDYQGTSVMNYADEDVPYTRIHEPKHLHPEKEHTPKKTVIIREYPQVDHEEPYYPMNMASDKKRFLRYRSLAQKERKVIFGGRLAEYRYYDMDEVIEAALKKFDASGNSPL